MTTRDHDPIEPQPRIVDAGPEAAFIPENHPPFMPAYAEGTRDTYTQPLIDGRRTTYVSTPGGWVVSGELTYDGNFAEHTTMTAQIPEGFPNLPSGAFVLNRNCEPYAVSASASHIPKEVVASLYKQGGLIDRAMGVIAPAALYGIREVPEELAHCLAILEIDGPKVTLQYSDPETALQVVYQPKDEISDEAIGARGRTFAEHIYAVPGLAPYEDVREYPECLLGTINGQTLIHLQQS